MKAALVPTRKLLVMASQLLWSRQSAWILFVLLAGTCSPRLSSWDQIERSKTLRLVIYNGPTTYYTAAYGPTGFDYDLAKRFADSLGVALEVVEVGSPSEVIAKLRAGAGDIGGGLTITADDSRQVRFSPPLYEIAAQLVYRAGSTPPKSLDDLKGTLEVMPDSSQAQLLRRAATEYNNLDWVENEYADSEELLYKVATGEADYTIGYSHLVSIVSRYQPELRVAFDIAQQQQMAWALPPDVDDRLYNHTRAFIEEMRSSGELEKLAESEFKGGFEGGAFVGAAVFAKHVKTRLPRYKATFQNAAAKWDLDWRLVAAVGYQESHWDPLATSPTGVRGLMMLTNQTARHLGVPNRLDPFQSINGGAKYIRELIDKMPEDIVEPDRTWLALATYNMGFAHLLDIRELTRQRGGDPSKWVDVRKHLPLLMQPAVYRKLKYGYARGRETMGYVTNVRNYHDILRWMTSDEDKGQLPEGVTAEEVEKGIDAAERALAIDIPLL